MAGALGLLVSPPLCGGAICARDSAAAAAAAARARACPSPRWLLAHAAMRRAPAAPGAAPPRRRAPSPPRAAAAAAGGGGGGAAAWPYGDADALVGYRAVLASTGAPIGAVTGALAPGDTGQPHALLRLAGARGAAHLVPLVPAIVVAADAAARLLTIDPPAGLLDLGARRARVDAIREELDQYFAEEEEARARLERRRQAAARGARRAPAAASAAGPADAPRRMPTRAALEAAGRGRLARAVAAAGGFAEVAAALGLRAARRPPGFWEDEAALDRELGLFVAAHWVRFDGGAGDGGGGGGEVSEPAQGEPSAEPSPGGGGYWYNAVTQRISLTPPQLPRLVALGGPGGASIFAEPPAQRAMPSRSAVQAAGRYDLHHAVVAAGGYRAVGEALGRRPAWPPSGGGGGGGGGGGEGGLRQLAAELRAAAREARAPRGRMPTAAQLAAAGRPELVAAVGRAGGFAAVAARLGWRTARRRRRPPRAGGEAAAAGAAGAAGGLSLEAAAAEVRAFAEAAAAAAPPPAPPPRMPSHAELRAAGRGDLRYSLQVLGGAAVAAAAGLPAARRGRPRRAARGAGGGPAD